MMPQSKSGFSTGSAYLVNLKALIPRHWFPYVVGCFFYLTIFINLDRRPGGDDSGHYFSLWLVGLLMVSVLVAVTIVNLMSKPVMYCMPEQQRVMRNIIMVTGLLISLLFFVLGVMPEYSYWAPQSTLGLLSLIPIGMMAYFLTLLLMLRKSPYAPWILVAMMMVNIPITKIYFDGPGPDLLRPPVEVYILLTCAALIVISMGWIVLGNRSLLRRLIGSENCAGSEGANVTEHLERFNLFHPAQRDAVTDFSLTGSGRGLLQKIAGTSLAANTRPLLSLLYRMRSGNQLGRILIIWLATVLIGIYFSFELRDEFKPVILLYLFSVLVTFQGAMIFRSALTPFLPLGRRAYFVECVLNATLRFLLVGTILLAVYAFAYGVVHLWPEQAWSEYFQTVLNLPFKVYAFFLLATPILLFVFHFSRSPLWMMCAFFGNMFMVYHSQTIAHQFGSYNILVILLLLTLAWLPFLYLAYQKSFQYDLK